MKTYKILSLLLCYPTRELQQEMEALIAVLENEQCLKGKPLRALVRFMRELAATDSLDAQERYVSLFDRGRAHSLHLFEHVHGESRERGAAMVDLQALYAESDVHTAPGELPDYLPLFLEFLSLQEPESARTHLLDIVHIVASIGAKLKERGEDYHAVFHAIEALSGTKVPFNVLNRLLMSEPEDEQSLDALDENWEEKPAFDGVGALSCGTCSLATQVTLPVQEGRK